MIEALVLRHNFTNVRWVDGSSVYDIYLPCAHGRQQNSQLREVLALAPPKWTFENTRVHVLNNPDPLSYKTHLWKNVLKFYGRERASNIMPESFDLKSEVRPLSWASRTQVADERRGRRRFSHTLHAMAQADINSLRSSLARGWMLKKEVHRQGGLELVDRVDDIFDDRLASAEYLTAQRYERNVLTIGGHKTSFRVYALVVCANARAYMYASASGFVYYTPEPSSPECASKECAITSGYVPRSLYADKPLSLEDAREHLGGADFDAMMARARATLGAAAHAAVVEGDMCRRGPNVTESMVRFQHFGCDFQVREDLTHPLFFECNKGPDFKGKDARDIHVKMQFARDTYTLLGARGRFTAPAVAVDGRMTRILMIDPRAERAEEAKAVVREARDRTEL